MVDRLSVPAFVFNPHGNVPTWVAIYTKTVGLIDQVHVCLLCVQPTCFRVGGCLDKD